METYPEEVRFVCLDGFRLAMQRVYVTHELPKGKDSMTSVIPSTVFGEIARMMPDSDNPATIVCSGTHMMTVFDQTRVYTPLIAGSTSTTIRSYPPPGPPRCAWSAMR